MTDKPTLLLSHRILEPMGERLAADYEVETLWAQDQAALIERAGEKIRAIVHAGDTRLTPGLLEKLPNLGLVACVSVGYDGVDVPWCRAQGIEVTHAPGLNAEDVADHAIGLMIGAYRGLVEGDRLVRSGAWERGERPKTRGSLSGKQVGIVGLGRIGEAAARRAEAFGMRVAWWGPRDKPAAPWLKADSLLALAEASDVLIVAVRAHKDNEGLISEEVIEALGRRSCLVNVARGQVVDEDAAIAALKDGRLGSAGLDVFWQEPTPAARWADVPNVVLTPHNAGSAAETVVKLVAQAMENLRLHFAGEPLLSPVQDS